MSNRDQSGGLGRRAFLGATAAGVASVVAPRPTLAQAPGAPAPAAPRAAVTALTSERLVGSAVNYAYAVKAGPLVFLNGHEGYDFGAGVVQGVAGAAGFPAYRKPGLRREALLRASGVALAPRGRSHVSDYERPGGANATPLARHSTNHRQDGV